MIVQIDPDHDYEHGVVTQYYTDKAASNDSEAAEQRKLPELVATGSSSS